MARAAARVWPAARILAACVRAAARRGAGGTGVLGRVTGGVSGPVLARRGGEDLGLDPVERLVEDHPQVGQCVLADRLGVPGGRPQVAGELPGQPLQVTVAAAGGAARARPAAPAGAAGPAGAACPPRPVTPAAAAAAAMATARFVARLILRLRVLRLRGLLPDVAGLAPGVFLPAPATLPAAGPAQVLLRRPARAPARPGVPTRPWTRLAHVPGGRCEFLAQAPDGFPDVLGDLAGDIADRSGDLFLQLGQVVHACVQLFPALVGDPVHLLAVNLVVSDQALFLQPGQPRVDRAG